VLGFHSQLKASSMCSRLRLLHFHYGCNSRSLQLDAILIPSSLLTWLYHPPDEQDCSGFDVANQEDKRAVNRHRCGHRKDH